MQGALAALGLGVLVRLIRSYTMITFSSKELRWVKLMSLLRL